MMTRLGSFWRSNAVTIGVVIIILAFGTILFFQAQATARLQEQTQQQTEILAQIHAVTNQLSKSSQQRTQQIATLTAHIDCIVTFFSQEDRSQKSIDDINTCTLKNTSTGTTSTLSPAPISSAPVKQTPPASTTPGAPVNPAPASTPPSGGSSQPSFFQRDIINPIKIIINGL